MEGFEDIEALPIASGLPEELCEIMYTDEYRELLGVARALMVRGERSPRALELTKKVLELAPAFYTVWNYRFDILLFQLEDLALDERAAYLNAELDWVDEFTLNNPKNYQIWSYKQAILRNHPQPTLKRELPVLSFMIDDDAKNYHVWSFRKWCVLFFDDFSHELQYSDELIQRDVYNNSAWSHRMFVLKHLKPNSEAVSAEVAYVMNKIELVPQNISVWTYLRGIYESFLQGNYDDAIIEFAGKFAKNVTDMDPDRADVKLPEIESSFALEFLAHVYSMDTKTTNLARKAYKGLSIKYDPIRKFYWDTQLSRLL